MSVPCVMRSCASCSTRARSVGDRGGNAIRAGNSGLFVAAPQQAGCIILTISAGPIVIPPTTAGGAALCGRLGLLAAGVELLGIADAGCTLCAGVGAPGWWLACSSGDI